MPSLIFLKCGPRFCACDGGAASISPKAARIAVPVPSLMTSSQFCQCYVFSVLFCDEMRACLFAAAFALLAEPHLLGELRARHGIIGCNHRIVGGKSPFLAILLGRHVVLRAQMALERLELLAIL